MSGSIRYEVKSGDWLAKIARDHGTTVSAIGTIATMPLIGRNENLRMFSTRAMFSIFPRRRR